MSNSSYFLYGRAGGNGWPSVSVLCIGVVISETDVCSLSRHYAVCVIADALSCPYPAAIPSSMLQFPLPRPLERTLAQFSIRGTCLESSRLDQMHLSVPSCTSTLPELHRL